MTHQSGQMNILPLTSGKRVPSPCGSVGSQSPPSVPPPSPDTARATPQFPIRGGENSSPALTAVQRTVEVLHDEAWEGSPATQTTAAGEAKTVVRGNELKGVLRIQDDEHHCDWAERRIRSLSMSILGLLFVLIAQGTILAIVVDRVYNPTLSSSTSVHFKSER